MRGFVLLSAFALGLVGTGLAEPREARLEALGERLFFETRLSLNETQSCATCHDPAHAFTDPRVTIVGRAVSLGDDGVSLGDRNAPTLGYAAHVPAFHRNGAGRYVGGLFHDGRAETLEDQAGGPPLNPLEMAMPDRAALVARLAEDREYMLAFEEAFGAGVLHEDEAGFAAMTEAIAAFERTDPFSPFDSRFDRYLRGEATLSRQEERGRDLFFDPEATNCSLCHQSSPRADDPGEIFTSFEYHNIGVPVNKAVRAAHGRAGRDAGLLDNPGVDHPAEAGRFRVPTLRNVAVTGPYMHNGVFTDLRTAVRFYNKYQSKRRKWQVNPETGEPWALPEVFMTLAVGELTEGEALSERDIDAIVAFLKTLTDARYEHLLED
ncbi:cytochrome-c peroxidase [Shimia sp. W99]